MKPGFKTSEFWIAAHWSATGASAVASLLHLLHGHWIAALIAMPAVCVLLYFAGVIANNYCEDRFNLKARAQGLPAPETEQEPNRGPMGFGRYVAQPSDEGEDEE